MTHEDASDGRAVEKYLLNELAPEELEEFEEHLFECPVCAAELRTGAMFVANARAVFPANAGLEASHRPAAAAQVRGLPGLPRLAFAFALGVIALLVAINISLLIQVNRLRAPQAYPAFFLHSVARGGEQIVLVPRPARFLGLSLDLPPGRTFPTYTCDLADATGRVRLTLDAPGPSSPGMPVNLLLPLSRLSPGSYTLIVRGAGGGAATELGQYPFLLEFQ